MLGPALLGEVLDCYQKELEQTLLEAYVDQGTLQVMAFWCWLLAICSVLWF